VAIEQFVIDLAGYYRSLMLLKAGVTRESLLGYHADRFSAKIQEKTSLQQLEEGLSILLGLYRDIRYSLSPRFELETAVSKLCWLDKWISPAELRNAVEAARSILAGAPATAAKPGQSGGTFAGGGAGPAGAGSAGSDSAEHNAAAFMDSPGAFTEGFKEFLARRQTGDQKENVSEEAETVRRVFRGTYVKEEGSGEHQSL
jgi:DNA polymerase-3 subunit gamma/tau